MAENTINVSLALDAGWKFRPLLPYPGYHQPTLKPLEWRAATVPGCLHLDLLRAGVIGDPFYRSQEHGVQWVDDLDWEYSCTFDIDDPSQWSIIHFDHLDTVATVFLNGEVIGHSDNYFRPLTLDISDRLKSGTNALAIVLHSAVRTGQERRAQYMDKHGIPQDTVWFDERAFVRKPGYMSGWDWGPRLVGAGILGSVQLLREHSQRLAVTTDHISGETFRVKATGPGTKALIPGSTEMSIEEVAKDEWIVTGGLWWPRGYGDQTLHQVVTNDDQVSFGLRTVSLRRESDQYGESFEFLINDRAVWARGANWIPDDSFPCRAPEKLDRVQRFADLNFNMLRVWGGGTYESDAFYEACDKLGVMVWQDFPFACMYYPDDEEWQTHIRLEAEHHVKRLRHHPSLVLWCGNNENLQMYQQGWDGKGTMPTRYFGENLFQDVLPDVVAKLSPDIPYIETSPIGIDPDETREGRNVNMDGFGDSHYWDVWHGRGDWTNYRDSHSRFSSEFGFASSCSMAAWRTCLGQDDFLSFPNDTIHSHNKTGKPWATFLSYVELHCPAVQNLDDWVYYSQLNQRDALRFGIEHYRRISDCKGSLIWQANDCWPVQSWAVEDYLRLIKPAGFELRRLYADILISVEQTSSGEAFLWLTNSSSADFSGKILIDQIDLEGNQIGRESIEARVVPDSSVRLTPITADISHIHFEDQLIEPRWHVSQEPKDIRWQLPVIKAVWSNQVVTLSVDGLAFDMVVEDPDSPTNIRRDRNSPPGHEPVTVANGDVTYHAESCPTALAIRCLAGAQVISVERQGL